MLYLYEFHLVMGNTVIDGFVIAETVEQAREYINFLFYGAYNSTQCDVTYLRTMSSPRDAQHTGVVQFKGVKVSPVKE